MHRSVLALLFAAVLLLSGCAAGRQTVPKEKSGQETNMDGAAFDRSDEEITYMDTTENVIYLAGGCFWGMEQLKHDDQDHRTHHRHPGPGGGTLLPGPGKARPRIQKDLHRGQPGGPGGDGGVRGSAHLRLNRRNNKRPGPVFPGPGLFFSIKTGYFSPYSPEPSRRARRTGRNRGGRSSSAICWGTSVEPACWAVS